MRPSWSAWSHGDGRGEVGRVANDLLGRAARLEHDDVVGLDLVTRDVHALAVDLEVAAHELPRPGNARPRSPSDR